MLLATENIFDHIWKFLFIGLEESSDSKKALRDANTARWL